MNELLAAYPAVPHAVVWTEVFVCDSFGFSGSPPWRRIMWSGCSPTKAVEAGRHVLDRVRDEDIASAIECLRVDYGVTLPVPIDRVTIRAEMGRPEFLTYIAGRMGAV